MNNESFDIKLYNDLGGICDDTLLYERRQNDFVYFFNYLKFGICNIDYFH